MGMMAIYGEIHKPIHGEGADVYRKASVNHYTYMTNLYFISKV